VLLAALSAAAAPASADPLRGSRASLLAQNRVAKQHDYTYIRNPAELRRFVNKGYLVRVRPTTDLQLADVSFPYARAEVKLFLDRLGRQYRSECREPLVVTSLTRPKSHQPRNASKISVHPTGMAIDLRRPAKIRCRTWLERTLRELQREGVLDATRERWPPHYHVALFPTPYTEYVARIERDLPERDVPTTVVEAVSPSAAEAEAAVDMVAYRVRRGDTLWTISRHHGTSVRQIRAANDLSRSRIHPGQVLKIPVDRAS
jgi:LysM repeat protein